MRAEEKKSQIHLGFLTALGNSSHGVIGGLLVLNSVGRPVEFHCTAPVRPNKAQVILYGTTLDGFVCGEQIAPALIGRSKHDLAAVLTNNPNMLTAHNLLRIPIGLVLRHVSTEVSLTSNTHEQFAKWDSSNDCVKRETDRSHLGLNGEPTVLAAFQTVFYNSLEEVPFVPGVDYRQWTEVILGQNRIALPERFTSESKEVLSFHECASRIEPFLKSIDSVEPFERIRLAVEEAQKSS